MYGTPIINDSLVKVFRRSDSRQTKSADTREIIIRSISGMRRVLGEGGSDAGLAGWMYVRSVQFGFGGYLGATQFRGGRQAAPKSDSGGLLCLLRVYTILITASTQD